MRRSQQILHSATILFKICCSSRSWRLSPTNSSFSSTVTFNCLLAIFNWFLSFSFSSFKLLKFLKALSVSSLNCINCWKAFSTNSKDGPSVFAFEFGRLFSEKIPDDPDSDFPSSWSSFALIDVSLIDLFSEVWFWIGLKGRWIGLTTGLAACWPGPSGGKPSLVCWYWGRFCGFFISNFNISSLVLSFNLKRLQNIFDLFATIFTINKSFRSRFYQTTPAIFLPELEFRQ